MKNPDLYKHWSYLYVHYVPVTPRGGGAITWEKKTEYREIYLPEGIDNPDQHLKRLSSENCLDLPEYESFSIVTE